MSAVEDIHKAQRDVERLQLGLDKVAVALQEAEKVAVFGGRVKRRAPVIMLAVAATAALGLAVVVVRRQRQQRAALDGEGLAQG